MFNVTTGRSANPFTQSDQISIDDLKSLKFSKTLKGPGLQEEASHGSHTFVRVREGGPSTVIDDFKTFVGGGDPLTAYTLPPLNELSRMILSARDLYENKDKREIQPKSSVDNFKSLDHLSQFEPMLYYDTSPPVLNVDKRQFVVVPSAKPYFDDHFLILPKQLADGVNIVENIEELVKLENEGSESERQGAKVLLGDPQQFMDGKTIYCSEYTSTKGISYAAKENVPVNTLEPDLALKMLDYFAEDDFCIGQNGALDSATFPHHQHFQLLKYPYPVFTSESLEDKTIEYEGIAISQLNFPGKPIKISFPYSSMNDFFINKFKSLFRQLEFELDKESIHLDYCCKKNKDRFEVYLFPKNILQLNDVQRFTALYASLGVIFDDAGEESYKKAMDMRQESDRALDKITNFLKK